MVDILSDDEVHQVSRAFVLQDRYKRVAVNHDQMIELTRIFNSSPYVRTAFEVLIASLLSGGIDIKRHDGAQITDELKHELGDFWMTLAKGVVRSLFVYGFVIIRKDEILNRPYVQDPHDVEVHIVTKNGLRMYEIRKSVTIQEAALLKSNAGYDGKVVIRDAVIFEKDKPDVVTGELTSPIVTLERHSSFLNTMIECAVMAQKRQAVPPLVTEYKTTSSDDAKAGRDYASFGDNSVVRRDSHIDETRFQNRGNIQRQTAATIGLSGESLDPVTGTRRYPMDDHSRLYGYRRMILEHGEHLVQPRASAAPPFLMQLWEMYAHTVSEVTGVPRSLWGSNAASVTTNINVMRMFYQSTSRHRQMLQAVLRTTFEWIHKDSMLSFAKDNMSKYESFDDWVKGNQIEIVLPGMVDPEISYRLFNEGFTDYKTTSVNLAKFYGLDPDEDMAKERLDPTTDKPLRLTKETEERQAKRQKTVGDMVASKTGMNAHPKEQEPKGPQSENT